MAQLFSRYASGLQFTAGAMTGSVLGTSGLNAIVDRLNSITSDNGAYSNLSVGEGLDITAGSVLSAELATSTNRGVATFNTANFTVTNGSVSLNSITTLGTNCVALDHGTPATDMVINVCYGSGTTPPTASTTTEGTLYIQFTP